MSLPPCCRMAPQLPGPIPFARLHHRPHGPAGRDASTRSANHSRSRRSAQIGRPTHSDRLDRPASNSTTTTEQVAGIEWGYRRSRKAQEQFFILTYYDHLNRTNHRNGMGLPSLARSARNFFIFFHTIEEKMGLPPLPRSARIFSL